MSYALLETYEPKIFHNLQFKSRAERPGWIPSHITENWDSCPFAYQTEEELMPAGGLHGQLLGYIAEMLRVHLKKQGLMLLLDTFLLYRDAINVKRRIGPDLLLMEDCFPASSAYDLDIRPPPCCVIEITSPDSHFKDLQENVLFYFGLGIETYLVIDAVTPQKKLREPIELHLWRKGKPFRKVGADNAGYFCLPEMNIKIADQQCNLIFVDMVTGNVLRDSGQLSDELEDTKQHVNVAEQRATAAEQRATAAEQRTKTAFEKGQLAEKQGIARNLLAKGIEPTVVAEATGLSVEELAIFSES